MELTQTTKNGGFLSPFWPDLFNDRFFDGRWPFSEPLFSLPPANVIETDTSFKIELAVPGFSKDDFRIDLDENMLSIHAEKKEEIDEEEKHYTRKEFRHASFSRSFSLPQNCNDSGIDAGYANGILTLTVPKKEPSNGRLKKEIPVK